MAEHVSREVLNKLRKLAQLAADLRRGESFEVTRLTILKSLCKEHSTPNRFVTYPPSRTGRGSFWRSSISTAVYIAAGLRNSTSFTTSG